MKRLPSALMPSLRSPSISSTRPSGSMTTPLPMTQSLRLRRMPDGTRCRTNFCLPMKTVCPALLPPWVRTTTSACSVSTSMILPLPSSPHWAPTRIVLAIAMVFALTTKSPEIYIRGGARAIYGQKVESLFQRVNLNASLADAPTAGADELNQMLHFRQGRQFGFDSSQGVRNGQPFPEEKFVGLPQRRLRLLGHSVAFQAHFVDRFGFRRVSVREHERRHVLH